MKQRSCLSEFTRYCVFSILGTLGSSCYILADAFFVSRGLGTNGLAALNLAIPAYNFIFGLALLLGMGGAIQFSILKGQKRQKEVDQVYANTMIPAIFVSALFVCVGVFFSNPVSVLLGAKGEVLDMTNTYLKWLGVFSPLFIINSILLCFVRNDDAPQLTMIAMLVGNFANIILDYVFIFPLDLGILGAILATGSAPAISILIMLYHWAKKRNTFHFKVQRLCPRVVGKILSLGFPTLVTQLSSGFVIITFNSLLLSLAGNSGVAAYSIIANISIVIVGIFTGMAQGVQPLIGNAHGMGDREKIKKLLGYSMVSMLTIAGVLYLLLFTLADPITSIFNSEHDPRLQEIAVSGIRIYFVSLAAAGYNSIIAEFFTSTERTRPAHLLSILRGLVIIIPLSFLMSRLLGTTGIWLTFPITEMIVAILGIIIYPKGNKKSYIS